MTHDKALESAIAAVREQAADGGLPVREYVSRAITAYLASITGEHGDLVERLCAASGILKKHPSEVYFGSQLCLEAADTITALSASNAAHIAEIARLRELAAPVVDIEMAEYADVPNIVGVSLTFDNGEEIHAFPFGVLRDLRAALPPRRSTMAKSSESHGTETCKHCRGTGQPGGIKGGQEHGICGYCHGSGTVSVTNTVEPLGQGFAEARIAALTAENEKLTKEISDRAMANPASDELVAVERFGMIDEAGGHEPLYWGRTNGLAPHGISGEEYVRYTDYAALLARLEAAEARADDARQNFLTMQGATNKLRIRAEAAEVDRDRLAGRAAEMEAVKSAGHLLANWAFNLAQMPLLSDDERRSLDESRQAFDAAIRALSNKEKADG